MYFGQRISTYNGYGLDIVADNLNEAVNRKWKLLLTPLSKVTDEHAIEVSDFWDNIFLRSSWATLEEKAHFGKYIVISGKYNERWELREYLRITGHAIPLFFGINHPCNGKTAIELGIAIDKTTMKTGL
jgi:hypothetical protein